MRRLYQPGDNLLVFYPYYYDLCPGGAARLSNSVKHCVLVVALLPYLFPDQLKGKGVVPRWQ